MRDQRARAPHALREPPLSLEAHERGRFARADAIDESRARLRTRRPARDQRVEAARVVLQVRRNLDDRRAAAPRGVAPIEERREWSGRASCVERSIVFPHDVEDHARVCGIIGVAVVHEIAGAQVHLDVARARHAPRQQHGCLAHVRAGAAPGATEAQHRQRQRLDRHASEQPQRNERALLERCAVRRRRARSVGR